jgi:hypothetical protein
VRLFERAPDEGLPLTREHGEIHHATSKERAMITNQQIMSVKQFWADQDR